MVAAKSNTYFTPICLIHIVIGLCIMFLLPTLGSPEFSVTASEALAEYGFPEVDGKMLVSFSPIGMKVICIFLGLIYFWTFLDTTWPTFLAVFALGASGFSSMNATLNTFMGNPNVIIILFVFAFAAIFVKNQISVYLARYLMTRDIVRGRPWVLTAMILVTTYLVAFLDQTTSVFIMWPVLYSICREAGYKKGDKFVSFMVVGVPMMAMLSFATDAIKGGAFILYLAGTQILGNPELNMSPMNLGSYLLLTFILSCIIICLFLLVMRFVYRVDVSLLNKFDIDILKANPLPPFNWKQKTLIVLFALYAIYMLSAGLLPADSAIGSFLRANQMGSSLLLALALLFINYKGEPLADMQSMMGGVPWTVYFLIAGALLFGSVLSHPSTHFALVIENVLRDVFINFSYLQITIAVVIIAIVITNFTNSVATGLILAPVLVPLCASLGYNVTPLLACFFFTVLIAGCTPAGSPYAALLFGNKDWINAGDASHYAVVFSIIVVISVIIVGVPLAQILF